MDNTFDSKSKKIPVPGLLDKNGLQVCEGDTVVCDNYKMYGERFTVLFDKNWLQWVGVIQNVYPTPLFLMKNIEIVTA